MSTIGSYKNTAFSEGKKFLVLDPETGSTSLVRGSSLVSYITPRLNSVIAESTRLAAENTDYDVGTLIQTSGATSPGDNFAATYLVVGSGEGDFPMINGNELLVIKGDEFLREQLVQPVATFDNVADMIADITLPEDRKARTLGYYTPGDGGGNDYEIVAGATGTADGGSFIDLDNGLQAKGLFLGTGHNANQFGAGSGDTSGATDTAAIQAYWDWAGNQNRLTFYPKSTYYITSINAPCTKKGILAYGVKFVIVQDGTALNPNVGFNLNPDADPANVEGTSKSYGYWFGGEVTSNIPNPNGIAGFSVYAVRQMAMRDVVFGESSASYLTSGVLIGGLGGHHFEKNRFLKVGVAFDCPDWTGGDPFTSSTSITTCKFTDNEFILEAGQKCFFVDCGWRSWKIYGGFSNGSESSEIVHFTNRGFDARDIEVRGLAFEQAKQNGKFIYFQDIGGNAFTSLDFRVYCSGDPAGGGHTAVALEKSEQIIFDGGRYDGTSAAGNTSISLDANCKDIQVNRSCRIAPEGVSYACSRREISVIPEKRNTLQQPITGYEGSTFSSFTDTIDMSANLSSFPDNFNPLGYTILVQIRDSGSAGLSNRRLELSDTSGISTTRAIVSLEGYANNVRAVQTVYVPADSNGDIFIQGFASGADTLEIYLYVLEIHQ